MQSHQGLFALDVSLSTEDRGRHPDLQLPFGQLRSLALGRLEREIAAIDSSLWHLEILSNRLRFNPKFSRETSYSTGQTFSFSRSDKRNFFMSSKIL